MELYIVAYDAVPGLLQVKFSSRNEVLLSLSFFNPRISKKYLLSI